MKDGYGQKLSDEETAKITGKPAQADVEDRHARPHVRPDNDAGESISNRAPPRDAGAAPIKAPHRDSETIDEP